MLAMASVATLVLASLPFMIIDQRSKNWFLLLTPIDGKLGPHEGTCLVNRSSSLLATQRVINNSTQLDEETSDQRSGDIIGQIYLAD